MNMIIWFSCFSVVVIAIVALMGFMGSVENEVEEIEENVSSRVCRLEASVILDKMAAVIEGASEKNKEVARRWISLGNFELHKIIDQGGGAVWGIVGASMALQDRWEEKFGRWYPAPFPVSGESYVQD